MAESLWGAFALLLIVEGLLPFLSPQTWRDTFRKMIELSDGQLRFIGLASIALARGDLDAATAALLHAREAWGGSTPPASWYHYAGVEALLRANFERATQLLAEGVARYPSSAVLLNNLSVAQEACGRFDEARRSVERAAQTDCAMPQLYRNLGDALGREGRSAEAEQAYLKAAAATASVGPVR